MRYSSILVSGQCAVFDPEDFETISRHTWHLSRSGNRTTLYAETKMAGRHVTMHRLILNAKPGERVEHRNGNGLDNRKVNLHKITRIQQSCHWGRNGKYLGVWPKKLKADPTRSMWEARIYQKGRALYLGRFPSKEAAALAYDRAALWYYGRDARTNLIRLDKIHDAVRKSDSHLSETDDAFKTAVIPLLSAHVGPNCRILQRVTGYPRIFIGRRASRLREAGIWADGKVHADWLDESSGGVAFWCDVLVAEGLFERSPRNGRTALSV